MKAIIHKMSLESLLALSKGHWAYKQALSPHTPQMYLLSATKKISQINSISTQEGFRTPPASLSNTSGPWGRQLLQQELSASAAGDNQEVGSFWVSYDKK